MATVELQAAVPIAATAEKVWAAATDWARQSEWMLGTEVYVLSGDGGPGSRLAAFTGVFGIGVLDTMEIAEWSPPLRCGVRHTGRLIAGEGGFRVIRRDAHACTFVWWERLTVPVIGAVLWPIARPALLWGLRRSLGRFATFCGHHGEERSE